MRNLPKHIVTLLIVELLVIAFLGAALYNRLAQLRQPVVLSAHDTAHDTATEQEPAIRTMLFVGDIMFDRDIRKIVEEEQDPLYPFLLIASTTRSADLTVANLEGPISDGGTRQGSIYSFRFEPIGTINALKYAGFDVVNLANNHIWDYGRVAALDTMRYLSEAGIEYVGFGKEYDEANTPVIKKVGDARVALFGYTEFYGSALWADARLGLSEFVAEKIIAKIKQIKESGSADIVIINLHWGEEYQTTSNEVQRAIAHRLIDAGADLIIGHHPHVGQELEQYKDGWIAYSLGNFIFDQNFSADTRHGLMLEVVLEGKKIKSARTLEIGFTKTYQPYILNL